MSDLEDFYIKIYVFKGAEAIGTGPNCLNTIFTKLPRIEGQFPSEFFFTIYIRKVSIKPQASVVNMKNKPYVERNKFHADVIENNQFETISPKLKRAVALSYLI